LGVRDIEGRDPVRLIWKGKRALPESLQVFRDENVRVIEVKSVNDILSHTYNEGILSVFVEGGSQVFTQFIESGQWDAIEIFCAPTILGVEALSFYTEKSPHGLRVRNVRQCGPDILISATPQWDSDPT
jgi:riboflavin biosynthesis pyrimidine reductase